MRSATALLAALLLALPLRAQTVYTVTNTANSGAGSLRQALLDANAHPNSGGPDRVHFAIPGAGPHTIAPSSALPTITDPIVIDGYTQPGSSPNTNPFGQGLNTVLKVELSGVNAGGANGLVIAAGGSTVRGLVINRFGNQGIHLLQQGGNVIEGCFIGTDVDGTASAAGGNSALVVD
ncbi:MAG TPA: hypothetical protein VD962_05625, partial [Rubricoccaceae bacterium]|nr:hypothetical protein [Rubricoccaceae bacterium]